MKTKNSRVKKKIILELSKLQEITTAQKAEKEKNKLMLIKSEKKTKEKAKYEKSKAEKIAKEKADYEAKKVLTEDKKTELDYALSALIKAETIEAKIKEFINLLDSFSKIEYFNIFRSYVIDICPDFYHISYVYRKVKKVPFDEQENALLEEYIKYLNDKENFKQFNNL